MQQILVCAVSIAMVFIGCASTPVGRTRALLEEGNVDAAAAAAGSSWAALREVSLAIAASATEHDATRHDAVRALEAAGQEAEPILLRLAASEDPLTSSLGAAALLRTGRGEVGLLTVLLQDRLGSIDPETRAVAVGALGPRIGDEAFFRTYLSDEDSQVRMAAVQALSSASDLDGAAALLAAVVRQDEEISVRAKALRALSRINGRSEVVLTLASAALQEESLALRLAAVDALSRVDERQRASTLLGEVLSDDDGAVRVRAAVILAGWSDGDALEALRETVLDGEATLAVTAAIGAGQLGAEMDDMLRGALERDDREVRLHAAAALLRVGETDAAMEALMSLLDEPGWVGLHAALIVARTHSEAALPRIGAALLEPDESLRAYAARSCSLMTSGDGLDLARRNLADRAPAVRLAAAATVLKIMAREG